MLTGLSSPDGNSRNHEVGVCLPQFTVEVTEGCKLTVRPKYAPNAFVSMLQVGEPEAGKPNIPRATDSIQSINDAVTNKLGYYYLDPMRCPAVYQTQIKGQRLLAQGETISVMCNNWSLLSCCLCSKAAGNSTVSGLHAVQYEMQQLSNRCKQLLSSYMAQEQEQWLCLLIKQDYKQQ